MMKRIALTVLALLVAATVLSACSTSRAGGVASNPPGTKLEAPPPHGSAVLSSAPSKLDTAAAIAVATREAGDPAATSVTAEHVVYKDPSTPVIPRAGLDAWLVTFHGLTLYPAGGGGAVTGMNHTVIIDAKTGRAVLSVEYRPK